MMIKLTYLLFILLLSSNIYSQCWQSIGRIDGDSLSTCFAIKEDGTLWAWGLNDYTHYGNGTTISSPIPVQISIESNWKSVTYDQSHAFGIKTNGTLWAWGSSGNGSGLGDGTTNSSLIPIQIGVETQWKSISAAWGYTGAIKDNGTIWVWGGTDLLPFQIGIATDWVSIYLFYGTGLAIKTDGTLWKTVWSNSGVPSHSFEQIGIETMFKSVDENYVIKTDGSLWYYSNMSSGNLTQVGVQVGTQNDWVYLSTGEYISHYCIKLDGTLWSLSGNSATQVGLDTNWKDITVGNNSYIGLKTDGTIYTWGINFCGQLGNGSVGDVVINPTLMNTAGCSASINEDKGLDNSILLYPNPTQDIIHIDNVSAGDNVQIQDVNGKLIYSHNCTAEEIDIDLNNYASKGVYFVYIIDINNEVITHQKVVVQ